MSALDDLQQSTSSFKIAETSATVSPSSGLTRCKPLLPPNIWLQPPCFHVFLKATTLRGFWLHQKCLSQHQKQASVFLDRAEKPTNMLLYYPKIAQTKTKQKQHAPCLMYSNSQMFTTIWRCWHSLWTAGGGLSVAGRASPMETEKSYSAQTGCNLHQSVHCSCFSLIILKCRQIKK